MSYKTLFLAPTGGPSSQEFHPSRNDAIQHIEDKARPFLKPGERVAFRRMMPGEDRFTIAIVEGGESDYDIGSITAGG